jgi:glycosyltransferase involved in cell wall biosynthesis
VDVAIDALRGMPGLSCRLTIVGGGRLKADLERRASGDPRIALTGPLPPLETKKLFERADVVLFPTRSDIYGLVLVEAFGAGVATVVAKTAGAVADLAVHGRNCIVMEDHRPKAWAETLATLFEDEDYRATLGVAGGRTVRNRWTIEHAADAMLAGLRLGVLQGATQR